MKISQVALWILGNECSTFAVDICSIILFFAYCLILLMPFYIVISILKYKRKK